MERIRFRNISLLFPVVFILSQSLPALAETLAIEPDLPYWHSLGGNIRPNEFNPQNFRVALAGKKGVYVGVGTFRALSAIGMGDFDHAVLLDYDSKLVEFNRRNIALIRQCETRAEYLSKLFGISLDEASLRLIDASPDKAAALLEPSVRPASRSDEVDRLTPTDLRTIRSDFTSRTQWGSTIFGNDKIFEKVRNLANRDCISIQVGREFTEAAVHTKGVKGKIV